MSNLDQSIPNVTEREQQAIERDRELGHHIPQTLVQNVQSLKKIRYKDQLREFSENYGDKRFQEIEEEFAFIEDKICRMLRSLFQRSFSEEIENSRKAELAAMDIDSTYRDHFIHPFQDFLLGAVIIDTFYEKFVDWYSQKLYKSSSTSLEACWLLTTVFHDRYRPIQKLKGLCEYENGTYQENLTDVDLFIGNIGSLYNHLLNDRPLEQWRFTDRTRSSSRICSIMKRHFRVGSHGVRGALSLLRHAKRVRDGEISSCDVYAALSAAIHDKDPRMELLKQKVFPLRIDLFPIPCLLLYCDSVQEWGRQRVLEIEREAKLVRLELGGNKIYCEVSFEDPEEAKAKLDEYNSVKKCIKDDLVMSSGVRMHLSTPA